MAKHIHHDVITEWIKDTSQVVQYKEYSLRDWSTCINQPSWNENLEYRIKPIHRPDYKRYTRGIDQGYMGIFSDTKTEGLNICLTFDGATKELKAVEMV